MIVVIDTREQTPLTFRKSKVIEDVVVETLNVGDYSIKGYENQIAFERKSIADLFGTIGRGHARFKRELQRASELDYFAIIVEGTFTDVLNKNFPNSHYSRLRGDVAIKILMAWKLKHGFDLVFCIDRHESATYIREVFKAWLRRETLSSTLKTKKDGLH